jgi:choline dehydrogenase
MDVDYIIVGSGSAGSVLANRLSANGKYRVVVLEAGGSDLRFFIQLPLGYGKLFYNSAVNWMYRTEADPGLAGQSDFWPRGKVLGGSSSINAMVYIRGHRADYDEWGQAAPGWGWDDVLPAYRAMEDNEAGADAYRGRGGPLFIAENKRGLHWLVNDYIAAAAEAGLPYTPDFNGETQEGAGNYQMTIKGGRRNSAARAFLHPAMARKNLEVITGAHVTRVLFEGKRAVGVEYRRGDQTVHLRGGEVILAGGAINSPQLLQLSGIGPGGLLADHGVPVLVDNPNVGAHLNDHQGINYTWKMKVATYNGILRPWWGKAFVGLQYLLTRGGPLAKSINHAGGFFRTSPDLTRPNMQLYFQAFSTLIPRNGERPLLTPDPFPGLSIGLSNCRPTSRGHIRIRTADPFQHPEIVANAFSTDHDVEEMLLAVKFLRKIAAQPSFARWIEEELRPGPEVRSDADMIADFRLRSGTVYHPSCTCRMGADPATSVLDARLRVRGVEGLRVCDASAFPNLVAGNTNGPAMMTGWRGADLILGDAR